MLLVVVLVSHRESELLIVFGAVFHLFDYSGQKVDRTYVFLSLLAVQEELLLFECFSLLPQLLLVDSPPLHRS